jgi:hypothetical protein
MTETSMALDEAFERMGRLDFELPNGFVNHGPMACEALDALGFDEQIDGWARWFCQMVGEGPEAVAPRSLGGPGWQEGLGDYRRLPEWIGYFDRAIADDGWAPVVEQWVPRLMPGLGAALFHGVIRTAQAVRAVDTVDTDPRRAELARSLGYWAARCGPGRPVSDDDLEREVDGAVLAAAALGARHYVARPDIYHLHGVTGAMAVDLLIGHIGAGAGAAALAQLRAEHAGMYRGDGSVIALDDGDEDSAEWDGGFARTAAGHHDAHQVKLVEACQRGFKATGDRAFVAAAQRVTVGR